MPPRALRSLSSSLIALALLGVQCEPAASVARPPSARGEDGARAVIREGARVPSGDVMLDGEYAFPANVERSVPLVVLVHGSGRMDRNGIGPDGCCDTYGLLAAGLAEHGIASFRYDKRGFGKSAPELGPNERVFPRLVDDVVAIVEWTRRHPRVGKITLLGHSEGSDVVFHAAPRSHPDAVISLGGTGRPLVDVLRTQLAAQVDDATLAAFERLIVDVRAGKPLEGVPDSLEPLFVARAVPWLRSSLDLDPTEAARLVRAPTCLARGEYDAQVTQQDMNLLAHALPSARVVSLPKASHLLKREDSPSLPQASYSEPHRPLAEGLVAALVPCVAR